MRTLDRAGCLVERLILPGLSSVARQMIDWRDTAVALDTADTTNMMLTFGQLWLPPWDRGGNPASLAQACATWRELDLLPAITFSGLQ